MKIRFTAKTVPEVDGLFSDEKISDNVEVMGTLSPDPSFLELPGVSGVSTSKQRHSLVIPPS